MSCENVRYIGVEVDLAMVVAEDASCLAVHLKAHKDAFSLLGSRFWLGALGLCAVVPNTRSRETSGF